MEFVSVASRPYKCLGRHTLVRVKLCLGYRESTHNSVDRVGPATFGAGAPYDSISGRVPLSWLGWPPSSSPASLPPSETPRHTSCCRASLSYAAYRYGQLEDLCFCASFRMVENV